jgi:hypothetical protein
VLRREVPSLGAGTLLVVHQCEKRPHLIDGEAKIAATADESKSPNIRFYITTLPAFKAIRPRQQTHLLLKANGWRVDAGPLCECPNA